MQVFPQRLPFLQFGPPATVVGTADALDGIAGGAARIAGGAAGGVAEPHIAFFAILPVASWQLPLASRE